jgi:intein/homing endonuclease
MTLEIGDFVFNKGKKWVKVKSIEYISGKIKTYNLKNVKDYNNFFANSLLVHNKYHPCGW